ncbi:Diacylglycerol kinase, catalytic domain containing protein [Sphingomonadaceae bacterium]|uniref:diacylglycerol/lipid kinase family protein n=1 Tax=Sphingorhabdus sp. TaxID=1902408 RepID=UPI001B63214C|nr:acylglycerol kinase family protein [Sphingorhabdus sp.]MCE2828717.1 acylglycerol kinase family protein [Sphingomonadales bacterium]WRH76142.1 MAG: acylglycerol kinase family protein [Sphingobium sp.]
MALVALLSNPHSTGNKSLLPQVRSFCATHSDVFHYEVEEVAQIARALEMIARVSPKVLVINGGDGTVQAALTELYHGGHFEGTPPPVAVLPNGKTNLIALDLGATGDPLDALAEILELAKGDLRNHVVARELIALSESGENSRPVIGMFLGGAYLAETILYCRDKIYPLGLPNGVSHLIAAIVAIISVFFGLTANFLPRRSEAIRISLIRDGELKGRFSVLIVTTLEKLLLGGRVRSQGDGRLKMMAVDHKPWVLLRMVMASLMGRLGKSRMEGIHISNGDVIRIDGGRSNVILDGEVFEADNERPIVLRSTPPVPFLKLAA